MTTNQTIDGVPRDDLELVLLHGNSTHKSDLAWDRLRALLDAKPAEVTGDDVLRWMDEHAAAQPQGWPLGENVEFGTGLKEVSWREGKMPALGTKLYAEQSAPVAVSHLSVKRYDRDSVSRHSDVEVALPEMTHYDHGPNLAEALARLAGRVARFHKLDAPTLATQPAPVAVVLPERLVMTDGLFTYEYVTGHNAAIDKMLGVES